MKKRTPKTIAANLLKTRIKVMKAHETMTSAASNLESTKSAYAELPARIVEATTELTTAQDRTAQATAELTKPLDKYAFDGDYRHGRYNAPRKYSSPVAQTVWDAERAEKRAREYLDALQQDAAKSIDQYTADAREYLEMSTSEFNALTSIRDNLVELFTTATGHVPTYEECQALTAKVPKKETPEQIEVRARILETGYVVMADNLALALKGLAEFQIDGIIYFAKHIFEWSKLETGQLTVTLDHKYGAITIKSDTSRATFKTRCDTRPAPALQFVSI